MPAREALKREVVSREQGPQTGAVAGCEMSVTQLLPNGKSEAILPDHWQGSRDEILIIRKDRI